MPSNNQDEGKTTILFVVNDPRFFITHRLTLAKGIHEAGYRVHVAAPTVGYGTAPQVIREAGFPLHEIPIERQGLNPLRDAKALISLVSLYRRLRPNVVHHVTVKPILYGSLAARLTQVPAVVNAISGRGRLFSTHTLLARTRAAVMRTLYRVVLRHPNMMTIFQNDEDRASFIRTAIVSESSSVLIPGSGTELSRFNSTAAPEIPPIVLLPARLLRQKGIIEFVSAAKALKTEGINARFVVVGDSAGNRDALTVAEIRRIREEAAVELWGWSDDIPGVMSRTAIVCLPSYHEGVPKALLDACAAGRPIVATDIPGCRVVVTNGRNGLLVPPRDSLALTNALRKLLTDPPLRAKMAAESAKIAARFDIALVLKATLRLYSGLETVRPGIRTGDD